MVVERPGAATPVSVRGRLWLPPGRSGLAVGPRSAGSAATPVHADLPLRRPLSLVAVCSDHYGEADGGEETGCGGDEEDEGKADGCGCESSGGTAECGGQCGRADEYGRGGCDCC